MMTPPALPDCSVATEELHLVSCATDGTPLCRDIISRGSLPLLIGNDILAELSGDELGQGIQAAEELTSVELSQLSDRLARQLRNALEAGGETVDLAETAGNAAALFVLCLKQNGIQSQADAAACTVSYDASSNSIHFQQTA